MNFDKYTNPLPYPSKSDFTTTYFYRHGELIARKERGNYVIEKGHENTSLDVIEARGTREVVVDTEAFKKAREQYNLETARLIDLFYADVKEDLGIADNPKADLLLSKAWELGHGGGYTEVYNYASDLVVLIE